MTMVNDWENEVVNRKSQMISKNVLYENLERLPENVRNKVVKMRLSSTLGKFLQPLKKRMIENYKKNLPEYDQLPAYPEHLKILDEKYSALIRIERIF
jgi:hypothetical protein